MFGGGQRCGGARGGTGNGWAGSQCRCESNRGDEKAKGGVYREIGELDLGSVNGGGSGGWCHWSGRAAMETGEVTAGLYVLVICFYRAERGRSRTAELGRPFMAPAIAQGEKEGEK